MSESVVDVRALAAAMEVRVKAEEISWRNAAGQIGVSPSLLSRLRNGQRPDLEAFAAITLWLGRPADEFFINADDSAGQSQPPLSTSVDALLRARRDLDDTDRAFLQEIFSAGLRAVQQRAER
ncbi:MAG: transcriptional regulator [Cellulomonadaceae bacterium]|nr:transcriptional regulator [Cellulomonadaceae bacterium]